MFGYGEKFVDLFLVLYGCMGYFCMSEYIGYFVCDGICVDWDWDCVDLLSGGDVLVEIRMVIVDDGDFVVVF